MATHSSVLAWRIPGTREPGGLLSMGSHRVGHYWSDLAAAAAAFPFSRGSFQPRDQTRSPALQADSLPTEPQRKPKNTAVSCRSFLQGIFPTQGLNPCLLCLLYWQADSFPLSHQESPLFNHAAAAKSLQSCPTLCDPIDSSPPGCLVPGILQARTLEWVFSNA